MKKSGAAKPESSRWRWVRQLNGSQATVLAAAIVGILGIIGAMVERNFEWQDSRETQRADFEAQLILKTVDFNSEENLQKLCELSRLKLIDENSPHARGINESCQFAELPTDGGAEISLEVMQSALDSIVDAVGLDGTFVAQSYPGIPWAGATVRAGQKVILYNPNTMAALKARGDEAALLAMMGHEVAHHVLLHIDRGNSQKNEIEADEWSGFAMAKLNIPLADALGVALYLAEVAPSNLHPPVGERLNAVQSGWSRGSE